MERVVKFLKDAEVYYLAAVEGNQPRVRPFGTCISLREGFTYSMLPHFECMDERQYMN